MHQYFIGPERGRRHQEHFLIDPWTSTQLKPTQYEHVPCALILLAESNRFAGTALMPIDIPQNERKERDTQLNRARAWIRDQADPAYFAFSCGIRVGSFENAPVTEVPQPYGCVWQTIIILLSASRASSLFHFLSSQVHILVK